MDFLKKAASSVSGEKKQEKTNEPQQDYVDKAFGMAAKKSGHNVDANTAEKITDAGRGMFEKLTGKKVDPKYSN
ncbi:hypothetical protein BGZ61DRAFT_534977 [Ilyonectria robusta]|uniref:uncharacterized protein n=1 Tax=Ilyonectria robusta TaxID=1079257 RepID=UPI001E8EA1A5|nr:uncharacterized protein BGZ61DRAFT_534977 [Ilyonectria robusta]KAH6984534.1 hypothetical protein BKA56DRAFT_671037 [Ilyonectria sp. MPI-CAGE-AT-0026]KAH7002353.1 hypothetical protein EDB80DRAFT_867360 [Ilyonectria destructans]KAH8683539.1 hypothetical protein BGZ61DRAFT_534977 [Ilyonectria robusta]